jgi:hypothetical protein
MSKKSWKEEFYPVAISKVKSEIDSIKHSLQKWIGLRKKNLKKHGIEEGSNNYAYAYWYPIWIDMTTCALCRNFCCEEEYFNSKNNKGGCSACPLFKHLKERCDCKKSSPYMIWEKRNDPEPMIKALKACLKKAEKKNKK